nr:bifunctional ADP-dependent NAD(P)H-hydrate dehydratase/NAD(P)H-hydrate epimerase [Planctomycetota bacterium]
LLGCERLDDDLGRIARDSAARWGQVVVLKSSTVWIADPSGRCLVHDQPNAALATAGTGDVLAGAITGLIAQGLDGFDAATLAVWLHRAAGRMVRQALGDAGVLASDLLPVLPLAMKDLKKIAR